MIKCVPVGSIVPLVIISMVACVPPVFAYEIQTHAAASEAATNRTSTDQTLKESLGIANGINEDIAGKALLEWIQEGSKREDNGVRFLNHFHNPLAEFWSGAGLFGSFGQSAILWGQSTNQCSAPNPGQCVPNWAWQDARQSFLGALTKPTKSDRDTALANLFEGLGRQIHLIQDAASPAHTRNDSHVFYNFEKLVRDVQQNEEATFSGWLANTPPAFGALRPDSGWQSLPANSFAPIPIARLLDTDRYTGGNPSITIEPLMGLSEYTNANFFSEDSVFAENKTDALDRFPFPARTSVITSEYPITLVTGENVKRLYNQKVLDGDTGYRLGTVGFLRDYIQRFNLAAGRLDKPGLDESVYRDYAERLLPRAVGYSAALLDYFFRGKLDVDLVSDSIDPSVARITGTNASPDALVDGTLTLYADDTTTGIRSAVTALDPTAITGVTSGGMVTSARFQIPGDAERFVAVYEGTLGNEVASPDQNVPGAVIGKVLGGVRVEEVFNDGARWKLRTPKGVFGLITASGPLTVGQYEVVKWGDTDTALVARSALDAPQPSVAVFEVPRRSGSSELDVPSGGTDVMLTQRKSVPFPPAVLLTTVDFTQTVDYRQRMAVAERSDTSVWVPDPPPNSDPNIGHYESSGSSFTPFTTLDVVYEQTIPFSQSFPVMLDLAHNFDVGTVFDPYYWELQDLTVDASGRPLGLVVVFLDNPQVDQVTVPVFGLSSQTGSLEEIATKTLGASFPEQIEPLLWALVDLEQGVVVASTAGPVVTISSQVVSDWLVDGGPQSTFWERDTSILVGGPNAGTYVSGVPLASIDIERLGGTIGTTTEVTLPRNGEQSLSVDGWLREDLRQAMIARGRYALQPATVPGGLLFVYPCDSDHVCSALSIDEPLGRVLQEPGQLQEARRPRPVGGNERLVLLSLSWVYDPQISDTFGYIGDLLVWDPGQSRAEFVGAPLPLGFHDLGSATGSAALVSSYFSLGGSGTTLFRLDPTQAPTSFPDIDLTLAYVLLEPTYLYNTADLKFHRAQPPLEATTLPATLANADGNPTGDYHAIRLLAP